MMGERTVMQEALFYSKRCFQATRVAGTSSSMRDAG